MASPRSSSSPHHEITKREAEVAVLLGRGCSYPQIAEQLGISASTARHHAETLADKFDGRITAKERAAGPKFLIVAWVSRLAGEVGEAQTAEELMLVCVEAQVRLRLALDEYDKRNAPNNRRREG